MKRMTTHNFLKKALCVSLSVVLLFGLLPVTSSSAKSANSSASAETSQNNVTNSETEGGADATAQGSEDATQGSEGTSQDSASGETNNSTQESPNFGELFTDVQQNNALAQIAGESEVKAAASLAAVADGPKWTDDIYQGTVRIGTNKYCGTLDDAIDVLEEEGGGTIEVFKDTTLFSSHTITKNITIKNITENIQNDILNPLKNGGVVSADGHPTINVTQSGNIIVQGGTFTVKGAVFQGNGTRTTGIQVTSGSSAQTHTSASPIIVKGGTVQVIDDDTTPVADTGVTVTPTTFTGFNTATGDGGGVFYIGGGTVNFVSGVCVGNTAGAGGGGVFKLEEGGKLNISGGTFTGNTGTGGGGVIGTHASNNSNSIDIEITGGTFEDNTAVSGGGGVLLMNASNSSMTTLSGGTFKKNHAEVYGSAISITEGSVFVNGDPIIEENDGVDCGAVYVAGYYARCIFSASNARIINNNGKNLYVDDPDNLRVQGDGLGPNARIGISNRVGERQFFCSTTTSYDTTPYLSCFSNDTNKTLIPVQSSSSTWLIWSQPKDEEDNDYVCYITNEDGITTYYTSLNAAIDARNELEDANATIEIFKSHNFSANATAETKTLTKATTIKNVSHPVNDSVDWTSVNGGASPVVTFAEEDRFAVGDGTNSPTVIFKGIVFEGGSTGRETGTIRSKNAVTVNTGGILKVEKGDEDGFNNTGTQLFTANLVQNFNNSPDAPTDTDGGGFICAESGSQVFLDELTVQGCLARAKYHSWEDCGGGSVAKIKGTASLEINGGQYLNNLSSNNACLWGEACIVLTGTGSVTINDGLFQENEGVHGVISCTDSSGGSITVKGNTVIQNNTGVMDAGAIFNGYGTTLTVEGNVKILNNHSVRCAGAIEARGTLYIKDSVEISGNTCEAAKPAGSDEGTSRYCNGGAIECYYGGDTGKIYISGQPRIYDNGKGTEGNITLDNDIHQGTGKCSLAIVVDSALGKSARIGVRSYDDSLNATGKTFGTTSAASASSASNIAGSFFNNKDTSLVSVPSGTDNKITWGTATVKETSGSTGNGTFVKYYDSLNTAITGVTSGNTLEILKSHALTGDATLDATKTCYIRNIVNPINDTENPFKDPLGNILPYVDALEPTIYFSNNVEGTITDYRLTIAGTATMEGVKFSGNSWTGSEYDLPEERNRTSSGILVPANATLNIDNMQSVEGDSTKAGEMPDGTARGVCETVVSGFNNQNASNTDKTCGGGFLNMAGNVNIKGGTYTTCKARSYQYNSGGGNVILTTAPTANIHITGGTFCKNGLGTDATQWGDSTILLGANNGGGGLLDVSGGVFCNNVARTGGFAAIRDAEPATTVNVYGDTKIMDNYSCGQGAVLYAGSGTGTGAHSINFYGNCLIAGNWSNYSDGPIIYSLNENPQINIYGNAQITGNVTSGASEKTCAVKSSGKISISENAVVYGNTQNVLVTNYANLLVGTNGAMGQAAKVGIYGSTDALKAEGNQFGTASPSTAANSGYLAAFYNDRTSKNGVPLRGTAGDNNVVKWEESTPTVKVTETVTKNTFNDDGSVAGTAYTDVIHTFSGSTAIADAFACVAGLPAGNVVVSKNENRPYQGYFPIELLYQTHEDYAIPSKVSVVSGDRPIMFTTAMTKDKQKASGMGDSGDGYYGPFDGTSPTVADDGTVTVGKAGTVTRGASDYSLFWIGAQGGSSGNVTCKNIILDGGSGSGLNAGGNWGGTFYVPDGSLTLDEGAVIQNSKNTSCGGAIVTETFNGNACSVVMKSTSAIVGCEGDNYGAAFVYKFKDTEPTFEMHDEAKILNCKALNGFGGALGVQNGKAVIDGSCLISGNSATAGASAIRLEGDTTLTMSDKAKITNNVDASAATSEHHGAVGGSSTAGTVFTGKVTLSGSPYIYDNTGSNDSDNQCNLIDSTAKNDGKQIYVDEAGLTKEAKIGVYSANNSSASLVFARTVASKSGNTTNSINFQNFKNDKNDTLTGAAGDENQIVWSKYIPVNIVINQEKYLTDHWYTLQLQNSTTGARTRFHVKVAAGTTSGNVICMVQAGLKNFISCVEDGSAYAYTLSNPVYVNTPDTSSTGKGEALGTDTDEKADSASFLCGLTVNSTNANKGNISTTSGLRELTFTSAWTTISNEATKITAQSGVTNTFNQEPTVGLFAAVRSFFASFG